MMLHHIQHNVKFLSISDGPWEYINADLQIPLKDFLPTHFFLSQEVAEPLQDLKEGMDQLEKNKTLRYILSTLLAIGNFLNGTNVSASQVYSCDLFISICYSVCLL